MESRFQNQQRTFQTNGDVLWNVQLPSNLSSYDGQHLHDND
jgi:hypothetical protein